MPQEIRPLPEARRLQRSKENVREVLQNTLTQLWIFCIDGLGPGSQNVAFLKDPLFGP